MKVTTQERWERQTQHFQADETGSELTVIHLELGFI